MPPVATAEQPRLGQELAPSPAFEPEETLEDLVLGAWEDLVREGRAACLVCGGDVAVGESCRSCGSELA